MTYRIEHGTVPILETDFDAEAIRHHQNIGEQNCRIEIETPDRLQRDFGRQVGRVAQIQKGSGRLPQFPVFRQIAPGLTHEPDRRRRYRFARQHAQNRLIGHRMGLSGIGVGIGSEIGLRSGETTPQASRGLSSRLLRVS